MILMNVNALEMVVVVFLLVGGGGDGGIAVTGDIDVGWNNVFVDEDDVWWCW